MIPEDEAPTQVVLMSDDQVLRRNLSAACAADHRMGLIGEASSAVEALALVERLRPNVVVADLSLRSEGLELIRQARIIAPALGIVVLAAVFDDDQAFAAFNAGASNILSHEAPLDAVISAVLHAHAYPLDFPAGSLGRVLRRRTEMPYGKLSPRERQVLDLLVEGSPVEQVARRLVISRATVRTHITNIFEKPERVKRIFDDLNGA